MEQIRQAACPKANVSGTARAELEEAVGQLEKSLAVLSEGLEPVLTPRADPSAPLLAGEDLSNGSSPAAVSVRALAERVRISASVALALGNRLDIP